MAMEGASSTQLSFIVGHIDWFNHIANKTIQRTLEQQLKDQLHEDHKKVSRRDEAMALYEALSYGLGEVDPSKLIDKAWQGIPEDADWGEIQNWIIQNTAMMISEEPQYSKLAARALYLSVYEQVSSQGILSFSDSIKHGFKSGLIDEAVKDFVLEHEEILNHCINIANQDLFEYFGLKTVVDRYLLKDPEGRLPIETPQHFFLRVACGLSQTVEEATGFYKLISSFQYMPSTPTLFNSGTCHPQMSSCYLLDSPEDSLEAIYGKYTDIALLSKFAGGIGVGFSRVRSRGSLIKGTNGQSNGIVPFLKTLDSSVSAVNQGGKRKGAACVYLESWHADIMDFLMLRDNTGDEAQRTHNINIANWIPDLFMKRVESDGDWSLFDPKVVPELTDLYGASFEAAYEFAEKEGLAQKVVKARDLYGMMMKTLAQTGNGWMTFKDACNAKSNQTLRKENVIHLSNLCTEIVEVTSSKETAVCNLGSINLSQYVKDGDINYDLLGKNVKIAVKFLDKVIDINFYPIPAAQGSNSKWRPVGLGLMGLQNAFFKLGLAFDDEKAQEISRKVQEYIYFHALEASMELSKKFGPHENFSDTRAAQGVLQFDLWDGVKGSEDLNWEDLRKKIKTHGLRNSLLIAIAPTATIASITGAYECIEPQLSNLFKRETLSGEFLQINPYLVADLKKIGLWNEDIRNKIKMAEGSVQNITVIPEHLRKLYRTVWEIPQRSLINMAADRGAFIDQSQSLNLFLETPTIGKVSSMYAYAWKKGLKTTYYMRSRGATRINKATVAQGGQNLEEQAAIACSLENPEACESCT